MFYEGFPTKRDSVPQQNPLITPSYVILVQISPKRLIPDSFLLFIKQLRSYPVRIPESLLYPGTY